MKIVPPKFGPLSLKGWRPKFGIGIAIGALLVFGTQFSGSDSAFALVLGGGLGVALGLTRRSTDGKVARAAALEEEPEVNGR